MHMVARGMSIARKSVREAEICSHTHKKVFMGHLFPLLTLHGEEMGEKGGKERPSILSVLSLFCEKACIAVLECSCPRSTFVALL